MFSYGHLLASDPRGPKPNPGQIVVAACGKQVIFKGNKRHKFVCGECTRHLMEEHNRIVGSIFIFRGENHG